MTSFTRRAGLLFLAAACTSAQTGTGDREWKNFLDWFSGLLPESFHTGQEVTQLYRKKLLADGLTDAEADKVLAGLRDRPPDPAFSQTFWNKHFERSDPQFRTGPNAFLVEVSSKLPAGKALDLGMGEGRNAIYLAQHGWEVTGVDYAAAGVAKARQRAQSLGLKLDAIQQDADKFDFGKDRWDLVCLMYSPGDQAVHDFARRLADSLKAGAYVVSEEPYETPKTLSDQAESWKAFGLKLLRLEYREEQSDWGQPNFGRLLFQKAKS